MKLEYVFYALSLLSLALHFVAPRTKTKVDDEAAEVADDLKDAVEKLKK